MRPVTSQRDSSSSTPPFVSSSPTCMASATASSSYGLTDNASKSSWAAPAASDSTIVPGTTFSMLRSLAAMYSLATKFMPSTRGVTRQQSARAYNAANSSIDTPRWMYTIGWWSTVENLPLIVLTARWTSSSMFLYSSTSWRDGTAMNRNIVRVWSKASSLLPPVMTLSIKVLTDVRILNRPLPLFRLDPFRSSKRSWSSLMRSARSRFCTSPTSGLWARLLHADRVRRAFASWASSR
mmetsp:Transcript_16282/g.48456  ORF Transcript_16282/g.48456 Transcript_16282/m.48456 type:complete len:238 (+) Transcript_16282:1087-1800(+)